MSIAGQNSIKEDPVFSLFCIGDLVKEVKCPECKDAHRLFENSLMLNVQEDLYFSGKLAKNFFQSDTELRPCKFCPERTEHFKKISLTAFPEVLVLRIAEVPLEKFQKACETKRDLTFKDKGIFFRKTEFLMRK